VGEAAAFQLSLTAPSNVDISCLPISSLTIHFTEDFVPLVVRHIASNSVAELPIRRVDLGHVSMHGLEKEDAEANLRWNPGSRVVFAGTMSSDTPMVMNVRSFSFHRVIADHAVLKVSKIVLTLEEQSWNIEVPFDSFTSREGSIPIAKWLRSLDPVQYFPITREIYSSVT